MRFADLKSTAARRRLTQQEVLWNKELIEEERREALHRPACVATPATPAPDTAPCKTKRGEANAAPMRVGLPPPRGRSRSPPPTPAKAAASSKRPPPPPPCRRHVTAKAAPNVQSGPATPATVATDPPPAPLAAATAATGGSASAPTPAALVSQGVGIAHVDISPSYISELDREDPEGSDTQVAHADDAPPVVHCHGCQDAMDAMDAAAMDARARGRSRSSTPPTPPWRRMDRDDSAAAPRDVYPPTEVEVWGPGPRGPRAQRQVQAEMGRYTSEAERDRQAHNQALRARCSAKRSATATSAKEETARCSRGQRNMADMQRSSQAGDVATANPEANRGNRGPI